MKIFLMIGFLSISSFASGSSIADSCHETEYRAKRKSLDQQIENLTIKEELADGSGHELYILENERWILVQKNIACYTALLGPTQQSLIKETPADTTDNCHETEYRAKRKSLDRHIEELAIKGEFEEDFDRRSQLNLIRTNLEFERSDLVRAQMACNWKSIN